MEQKQKNLRKDCIPVLDDMTDRITKILNDPESMKQIMDMAAALSQGQSDAPETTPFSVPPELTEMLHDEQEKEVKQQTLVQALLPYLRPRHQKRLQQAVQVARLTRLAGSAWRTSGQIYPANEERDDHV